MRRMLTGLALMLGSALPAQAADTMTEVNFMDQQPKSGGYVTRYLLTDRYLRMDTGQDREDFTLFDRKTRVIYNVTHDQHQIMVIEPGPITLAKPVKWEVKEEVLIEANGQRSFDIKVNEYTCSRLNVAPGFLPEVAKAMADLQEAMSATQEATYLGTPAEMRHPCDLARYILEPRRWYQAGFPMYEANPDGSVRRLLNYEASVPERRGLFALPASYRTVRMSDLQGRSKPAPK